MRAALLKTILVTLLAGFLTWQMIQNNGYILIAYGNYTVDMNLWVLVFIFSFIFIASFLLKNIIRAIIHPSRKLFKNLSKCQTKKNQLLFSQGLLNFVQDDWIKAQQNLEKSAKSSPMPAINYLTAAFSAYKAGDINNVDILLTKAQKNNNKRDIAVPLMRAKIYIKDQDYIKALHVLKSLHRSHRSNHTFLKQLYVIYRKLNDFNSLRDLLPDLKRCKIFQKNKINELEIYIYRSLIENISKNNNAHIEDLKNFWKKIPRSIRKEKDVLLQYSTNLYGFGEEAYTEKLVRNFLKSSWDDQMVRLYGKIEGIDKEKQLNFAEGLLINYPAHPDLLLVLGRLNLKHGFLIKAQDYLERSIAIRPDIETYNALGILMGCLNEHKESLDYYREGLSLSLKSRNTK